MQSGCCKPPTFCGFQYKNATFWTIPTTGLKSTDADCKLWSNEQDKLCYDCGSCKAGVLATLKAKWKAVSIFNVALLVILIIVYSIGCCALRNNRAKTHGGYYPYARWSFHLGSVSACNLWFPHRCYIFKVLNDWSHVLMEIFAKQHILREDCEGDP